MSKKGTGACRDLVQRDTHNSVLGDPDAHPGLSSLSLGHPETVAPEPTGWELCMQRPHLVSQASSEQKQGG